MKLFSSIVLIFAMVCCVGLVRADDDKDKDAKKDGFPTTKMGYLGAKFGPISDDAMKELDLKSEDGVIVMQMVPESPAIKAGLMEKDVITKIDDQKIEEVKDFMSIMQKTKPEQEIKLTVIRNKEEKVLPVTLGVRPADLEKRLGITTQPTTKPE